MKNNIKLQVFCEILYIKRLVTTFALVLWNEGCPYLKPVVDVLEFFCLKQIFCYLYGIEGCSFFDLIADNPKSKSIIISEIFADTADIHRVFPGKEKGHRVLLFRGVILYD